MVSGMCPMKMPGAAVTVVEVEGGVALTFTTTNPADVDELRGRVKRVADMHNQGGMMGGGMMGGGMMGGGMMGGGGGAMPASPMPSATAATEDVDGGARLTFKPKDTAQLEALREHVKQAAEGMQKRRACPIMTAQTAAAPSTTK